MAFPEGKNQYIKDATRPDNTLIGPIISVVLNRDELKVQVEHEFDQNPACLQFGEQVKKMAMFGNFAHRNPWL